MPTKTPPTIDKHDLGKATGGGTSGLRWIVGPTLATMGFLGALWVVLLIVFVRSETGAIGEPDPTCAVAGANPSTGQTGTMAAAPAAVGPALHGRKSADYFTNFGAYMPRIHCLSRSDGKPDWTWITALIVLNAGIILAYLRIYVFWCKAYLSEDERDRNVKLMDLAQVFLWCAVCGYASSILMFVWPAYRLVVLLLIVLNIWSWRFALNLKAFRVSFSANRYRRLAESDALTGLLNRTALRQRIEQIIADPSERGDAGVCVYFLDLDRFKMINDSLGHDAGDALICQVADRLRAFCAACNRNPNASWTAARMGGDEFAVLGVDTEADASFDVRGKEMLSLLQEGYDVAERRLNTSASIGMCVLGGRTDAQIVLRDADLAMYESKRQGRGQLVSFDQSTERELVRRLKLEQDLRYAIERGALSVRYQPIVSIEPSALVGAEATVHWTHAEYGEIDPEEILSVAEDASMTGILGLWVLEKACRQLGEWRGRGWQDGLTMSVNLYRSHLREEGMVDKIVNTVQRAGASPSDVRLEFSEDAMIASIGVSAAILETLREAGFRIDMDQFGAGVSSLHYLHALRLDRLKIDRRLTAETAKRDHAAVLQALITLAQNLGFELVAEGVERPEQIATLLALDCTLAQGSLFGEPALPDRGVPELRQASLFESIAAD